MADSKRQAVWWSVALRKPMKEYRIALIGVVSVLAGVSSDCSLAVGRSDAITQSRDTSAFAAVVKAVVSDSTIVAADRMAGRTPAIGVDPRPLRAGDIVTQAVLDSAPGEELVARAATLRALGITADEAQEPPGCGSRTVPTLPGSRRTGCPTTWRVVIAVGRPRPGDATRPTVASDSLWTARVILAAFSPDGSSTEGRDYVLERLASGWRVVRMKVVGYDF
jgi:hypothetical protein